MDTLNLPVKKLKLIFDKNANVVAYGEPDTKKLEEEYKQIKRKKQIISIIGPVPKIAYSLTIIFNEESFDLYAQSIVASSILKNK